MIEPAEQLFNDLDNYRKLERLIEDGEAEGLYLECKAPTKPTLDREQKAKLAQAVSGFSNTEGGVIIWGISTTKHAHSGLDILNQLEPIGACKKFAQQIEKSIPVLTTPPSFKVKVKSILKKRSDTKGITLTYIPKTTGDPVQSIIDNIFYFRSGDDFTKAPYEMIKRLFAATESPDLAPILGENEIRLDPNGKWYIQVVIENKSSAVAENGHVSVTIENPASCAEIGALSLRDISHLNPGKKMFGLSVDDVVHRGIALHMGQLNLTMVARKRKLNLEIVLYANKMRARVFRFSINLFKDRAIVRKISDDYLY